MTRGRPCIRTGDEVANELVDELVNELGNEFDMSVVREGESKSVSREVDCTSRQSFVLAFSSKPFVAEKVRRGAPSSSRNTEAQIATSSSFNT